MAYILNWKNPAIPTKIAITVPVASIVSNKASLRFTGKGAANYGVIQQENLMRLLENFADSNAPQYPTVGQTWYDTTNKIIQLCTSTAPVSWKSLNGIQVSTATPTSPVLGDMWFRPSGSASGILHIYTGVGRHPVVGNTIGGWAQVWPMVEIAAGREEYDYVHSLVNQLIGTSGGNGALGKAVKDLSNMTALDTSLQTKWQALLDTNVLNSPENDLSELRVDPTSQDWDKLLGAAKYAVNRLELPAGYADDISPVPFVSDGRPPDPALMLMDPSDIRYPTLERRSNRRFGMITLMNSFSETVNVLTTAIQNRYSIKGINGASGSNPNFDGTTTVASHAQYGGTLGGITSANIALRFTFPSAADRDTFLRSGGAIQISMDLASGSTAGDTNMKTLLDQRGVVRLNADRTRVFANSLPYTLAVQPTTPGLTSSNTSGITLTTQTVGGANFSVASSFPTATTMSIAVTITSTGVMQGNFTIRYQVIKSNETYLVSSTATPVFGSPIAHALGDKTAGTAAIVFQS